jgi:hypothetical protein
MIACCFHKKQQTIKCLNIYASSRIKFKKNRNKRYFLQSIIWQINNFVICDLSKNPNRYSRMIFEELLPVLKESGLFKPELIYIRPVICKIYDAHQFQQKQQNHFS